MRRENARWRPEEAVARLRRVCLKTSNLQEQLWAEQGTDRWTWCPLPCACPGPLRRQPWRRRETFGHWWLTASQQSGWGLCVHLSEALWGNSRKPEDWAAKQPPETSSCSDFLSQSHQKHLLGPFKEHLLGICAVLSLDSHGWDGATAGCWWTEVFQDPWCTEGSGRQMGGVTFFPFLDNLSTF